MSKRYSLLLLFVLVLFACLLLILCYFNRLATDDFFFIWDVRNHGIIKGVTTQYLEWCGRFSATFFMDIFYKWFDIDHTYYSAFPLLSALILLAGIHFILRNLSGLIGIAFKKHNKLLASSLFTTLLFFLSVDIGESWFWFCGFSSYLWSIIAFVWGMGFLLSTKRILLSGIAAVSCFIYVGGASEIYSAIFGLFLTILVVYKYKKAGSPSIFFNDGSNKKLITAYAFLGVAFIIFLIAPGNYLRDGLFPERRFFYSFFITAKSFVKFGALYLPFKIPAIVAFSFPFIILGNSIKSENNPFFKRPLISFFYRISVAFAILLFVFFFMVAYVMVETGPPRIWFLVSFLLSIYCCLLCFYAGYRITFAPVQLRILKYVNVGTGIILLSYCLIVQYHTASRYAAAYDQRIEHVLKLNSEIKNDTLITLLPLPPAGMLYSAEISADTNHFTNKELRLGYDLKYHVALGQ